MEDRGLVWFSVLDHMGGAIDWAETVRGLERRFCREIKRDPRMRGPPIVRFGGAKP